MSLEEKRHGHAHRGRRATWRWRQRLEWGCHSQGMPRSAGDKDALLDQTLVIFLWALFLTGFWLLQNHCNGAWSHEIERCLLLGRKVMTNLDSILKTETLLCQQGLSSQSYGFSNSHVWMWELDYKESWLPKNWCFWTVVLEKTLESPLDSKEIQPVHHKGNQSWMFIGRTDVEAETAILWPSDAKN